MIRNPNYSHNFHPTPPFVEWNVKSIHALLFVRELYSYPDILADLWCFTIQSFHPLIIFAKHFQRLSSRYICFKFLEKKEIIHIHWKLVAHEKQLENLHWICIITIWKGKGWQISEEVVNIGCVIWLFVRQKRIQCSYVEWILFISEWYKIYGLYNFYLWEINFSIIYCDNNVTVIKRWFVMLIYLFC